MISETYISTIYIEIQIFITSSFIVIIALRAA
jgi:hypothetical protein